MPSTAALPDDVQELIERHRRDVPLWGGLPAAMRLKRALVRRLGPLGAYPVAVRELNLPDAEQLVAMPVGNLYENAKRSPDFRLLRSGGERFRQPEPHVIGSSIRQPMWGRSRSAWLASFEDVTVRSRSNLLHLKGAVLVDREMHEAVAFEDNPEYDPAILHAERDVFWTMQPVNPRLQLDEAFMLSGSHTIDFGHWLTECLPRLGMALEAGWSGGMPVLIDERIPRTIRAALPALLPRGSPLVEIPYMATVHVKKLWTVPNPMFVGFYPTQFFMETWDQQAPHAQSFCSALEAFLDSLPFEYSQRVPGVERLYLARRPGKKKALRNYAEIEDAMQSLGFARVYPEDLSFAQQVQTIRSADFIVAPEGSNNLLALFATPGTRLCTLNPPYTHPLTDVNALLAQRGVMMQVFTGPAHPTDEFCPFWWDYEIDAAALTDFTRNWLAAV
jgi:capsular polysaccharide biosynthesis protein